MFDDAMIQMNEPAPKRSVLSYKRVWLGIIRVVAVNNTFRETLKLFVIGCIVLCIYYHLLGMQGDGIIFLPEFSRWEHKPLCRLESTPLVYWSQLANIRYNTMLW